MSTSTSVSEPLAKFIPRRSEERGHADHGWLKTFHTFSFAMYQDPKHEQYGPLRVINEDRVEPRTGFGTHSHREFEIFSYVVSGELEHKDSMGNTEVLRRGAVQLTSAGTGISHSEKAHGQRQVHFLQIWSVPAARRLAPAYYTREFADERKKAAWVRVVAPAWEAREDARGDADAVSLERSGVPGPAPVQSDLTLYATLLEKGRVREKRVRGKKGYVHVVQTSGYNPGRAEGAMVRIVSGTEELVLKEGDGAYLAFDQGGRGGVLMRFDNEGDVTAEVLLFDMD